MQQGFITLEKIFMWKLLSWQGAANFVINGYPLTFFSLDYCYHCEAGPAQGRSAGGFEGVAG